MTKSSGKTKAVFLDRDGVLNEDKGYTYKLEDLKILPGVPEALKKLADNGFLLIVITNQSGVARGKYSMSDVYRFNDHLRDQIVEAGGPPIDEFYICPYHEEGTVPAYTRGDHPDRKPNTGMIQRAVEKFGLRLNGCYLVGDKFSDIECAVNAGIPGIQVKSGESKRHPEAIDRVKSLADAIFSII